jgi:hypothetical protein
MEGNLKEQVAVADQVFNFSLCRKQEKMGEIPVDHWWMNAPGLYGQRNHRRGQGNYQAVTDCFWAQCREAGSDADPEVQESHLLTMILPYARNQGSRRIFADAWPEPSSRANAPARREAVAQLDEMLRNSRGKELTRLQFRDQTGDVLGPPALTEEAKSEYWKFTNDFLGNTRAALDKDEAAGRQLALKYWDRCMKSVGRRADLAVEKQVLDVVSYESRAALHRCYSAAWCLLLPQLAGKYGLTEESYRFLQFWHLEQVEEAAEGSLANFHLFHGHVFALHPASGEMLRTAEGRALVGDWLSHPADDQSFGRLLHGIHVAVHHYAQHRDEQASRRKKQPTSVAGTEMTRVEEELDARRSGRRKTGGG